MAEKEEFLNSSESSIHNIFNEKGKNELRKLMSFLFLGIVAASLFASIDFIKPTKAAEIGWHAISVAYYEAYIHNDHDRTSKGEWKFGLRSETLDYIESPRGRLRLYIVGNNEEVNQLDDDLNLLWYFSGKTWFKLRAQEYDSLTDPLGWLEEPVWVDYTSEVQINVDVMVGANTLHSGAIKQGDVTHYYRYYIRNLAPTARAIQDKLAYAGVPLQFYGSGSDPDGDSLSYEWKFGDGTTSQAQNPIHTYKDVGNYTISFRVKDALGAYSEYQIANVEVTTIVIDQMFVSDNRCNVDSVQTIGFHAKWAHNELLRSYDVVGGSIYVNENEYVTNGTGWVTLNVTSDSVGMLWWNITEINCAGMTEFVQEVANVSIIWDKVNVTLSVENDTLELGSTANIAYTAVYEFDQAKFKGTITLNDTLTESGAGTYYCTTESISGDNYGITAFESNTIAITFVDTMARVRSLWIVGSICVVVAAATIAAALLLRRRRTHKGS